MRRTTALVILVLSVFTIYCGWARNHKDNGESQKVLENTRTLNLAVKSKDFVKVWELSSPWVKEDNPKNEYVEYFSGSLEDVDFTKIEEPTLVVMGDKYAVTQTFYTIKVRSASKVIPESSDCQRTLWLKFLDDWYWEEAGLPCNTPLDLEALKALAAEIK